MNMVPYNIDKIPGKSLYKKSDNLRLLEVFANSDYDCVKVENYRHANAASCCASLVKSIKRYKKSGIRCVLRKGEVFLVKSI